jgi:hypothetical protein
LDSKIKKRKCGGYLDTRKREGRNVYIILVRKCLGKGPLRDTTKEKDNAKMDIEETSY